MASYPNNYGGIISAINACIATAGGTVTSYPNNTGGIIQALIALNGALGGLGGGSAVMMELEAAQGLNKGDVVYIDVDGKVAKANHASSTRDGATVAGMIQEDVASGSQAKMVVVGKVDITGWGQSPTALTPGARYFLNGNGFISVTPPSGSGEYLVLVGEALDETTIALNIDVPVLLS